MLALNRKIDLLSAQVQFLTEQAQAAERQREERAELLRDLTPIVNDAYRLTVEQLEEVEQYVDLNDLLRLFKRLLRNGRNFDKMLDQLESTLDLRRDGRAVERSGFRQGGRYAGSRWSARATSSSPVAACKIVDNIVTSFGEEDVRLLGENVVLILQTIKEMTQPEVMSFVRNTVKHHRSREGPAGRRPRWSRSGARCRTQTCAVAWPSPCACCARSAYRRGMAQRPAQH